ncbi:MAG: TRAP transporter large permease [Lentisphaeria bacterium]|nr:TRAP transporter large permease [Lentisphaeria bacterium]
MSLFTLGVLGILLLLLLLMLSMPVGFALAVVGCMGFAMIIHNPVGAFHMLVSVSYETFSKYDLSVIPLFILMGQVSFHAGISRRLFDAAYRWLGRLPGGLGVATIGACAAFGAICGSGPATAATIASVSLPEMRRHKYHLGMGAGLVAAGGSLGMLIPPSVVFIVYGIMTELSPATLFMAGVVPGLILTGLFSFFCLALCAFRPELGPPAEPCSWGVRFRSLLGVIETALLFLLVMGGMFIGWFTPTEAAAVGAAGSIVVALCRRTLSWKTLVRSLMETIRVSTMVLIIIAGAMVFGRFLALTRLPSELANALTTLAVPAWVTLALILLFYLVAGCMVDALALVLLTIPIFFPVIKALQYDPVWFGVMVVLVVQMGVITPPVGVNVYVVSGIDRRIPLQDIFRGSWPYVVILVLMSALMLVFPDLALVLPRYLAR